VFPPLTPEPGWAFEGSPVTDGRLLYVTMRRNEGDAAQLHAAAFDAATGRRRWQTLLAAADTLRRGNLKHRTHNLLTLVDGVLLANTNLGAIAAIDADSGRRLWVTTYPRQGPESKNLEQHPWHVYRELNPCVYHEGMLYAAPRDSNRIFALSAHDGRLIWESRELDNLDAVHLLGAEGGRLIASGRRLWWFNAYSGQLSRAPASNPFPPHAAAPPFGYGRGVIRGGRVYWPARGGPRDEIYVFDASTGRPTRQPIVLRAAGAGAGNLVPAGDFLLIAGPDRIDAYHTTGKPPPDDK